MIVLFTSEEMKPEKLVYGNKLTVYSCTIEIQIGKEWGNLELHWSVWTNNKKTEIEVSKYYTYDPGECDLAVFVGLCK